MDQRDMHNDDVVLDLVNPSNTLAVQVRALRPSMMPGTARVFTFAAPAQKAAGVDDIVTVALLANSATLTATIAAQPATPRNVRVKGGVGWDGGNVTIVGTDIRGAAVTEVFLQADIVAATKVGKQGFKTITSITKSAVGAAGTGINVGIGDALAVPQALVDAVGMAWIAGTYDAPTLDATYSTYSPTSAPDGAKNFTLIANV